jgi:hypothetical protein
MAGGIHDRRPKREFRVGGEPGAGRLFLRRADLDDQMAAWCDALHALGDKPVEDDEAAGPAVEGQVRLVVAHADRQLRQVFGGNVRRIADHQIE